MANIKVLMVDDEEQFRETTSKILGKKGYDTTIAGSGEEAIDILKEKPQDVVILDIKMPGMDGHQALSKIKEISPDTKVIMLTGHGAVDSARESLKIGAFDYLTKPCDIDLLAAKIRDAYASVEEGAVKEEKTAGDLMVPIDGYSTISADDTVKDAVEKLEKSYEGLVTSGRIMETGHRSLVVFDKNNELAGIMSVTDLMGAVRPAYLSAPKPSTAEAMQYSFMFWQGLFGTQMKALADKKVGDIMSGAPPIVDESANIMELADLMYRENARWVLVTSKGKIAGLVREQAIFFEMANAIK